MLHVTAPMERKHLEKYRLGVSVEMIPNEVVMPPEQRKDKTLGLDLKGDGRAAPFMSRLRPIKGLLMLLEAWARVKL